MSRFFLSFSVFVEVFKQRLSLHNMFNLCKKFSIHCNRVVKKGHIFWLTKTKNNIFLFLKRYRGNGAIEIKENIFLFLETGREIFFSRWKNSFHLICLGFIFIINFYGTVVKSISESLNLTLTNYQLLIKWANISIFNMVKKG